MADISFQDKRVALGLTEESRRRSIPLSEDTLELISRFLTKRASSSPFLFAGRKGNAISPVAARTILRKYVAKSGVKKTVSGSILRASFARTKLKQGMDPREVASLLGLRSLA